MAGAAGLRGTGAPVAAPPPGQAGPVVGGLSATSVGVLVVDGGRHQCTAAVVASQSRRLLATAAHCVWLDGRWELDGAFFVPGFAAGEEPLGRWAVDRAWVSTAWQKARSPIDDVAAQFDVAFVSLKPRDGQLPERVLGAQGAAWDSPAQLQVAALGYPSLAPYDGSSLRSCVGPAHAAPFRPASARSSDERGSDAAPGGAPAAGEVLVLRCDMTAGASGGPWLTGPDAARGRGQIVGVVSGGDDTDLVSPRFGAESRRLYQAADSASSGPSNAAGAEP